MLTGRRIAKTAAVLVATTAVVAIVFAIIDAVQTQLDAARRTATKADLKRIMIAMHPYHDEYHSFAPAFVVGPDGKQPWFLGWIANEELMESFESSTGANPAN